MAYSLTTGSAVIEAFDRLNMRPAQLDRHHMMSARASMNLELIRWENIGVNLWKVVSGTTALIAGQATYTLPVNLVTLTDVWYSTVTGPGSQTTDRILTPITRQEYAAIPDKLTAGSPNQYWLRMLAVPTITFWQPPAAGAPDYLINWYGFEQSLEANVGGLSSPDVLRRAYDALCAALAWRLAQKFAPQLEDKRKVNAQEAWIDFATRDQEDGPLSVQPNVSGYARIS